MLADAYIGTPKGDLRSDSRYTGMVIDESGNRYVPIGKHYYAVRNDPANGTWRAVQLQDPAKPGIPIRQDREGNWSTHGDAGLRGGSPDDIRVRAMRQDLERRRDELNREVDSLNSAERTALMLIDGYDAQVRSFENQLRMLQPGDRDYRDANALVAQLRAEVAIAQNSLREVRNMQYAKISALRETKQQLSQLPKGNT
jgi:hypothetical protein